jgi:hypothetical protein
MCWFSGDATIFCNNFARWLQKIVATCDVMCWVFWDAMIFCNNFMLLKRRFSKTKKHFGPSFWALFQVTVAQPSATRPLFGTNLHFGQFVKTVNHEFRLKFRDKCLKWRFVPIRGRVADGCCSPNLALKPLKSSQNDGPKCFSVFENNFARWLQKIVATCDVLVFWGCYYLL